MQLSYSRYRAVSTFSSNVGGASSLQRSVTFQAEPGAGEEEEGRQINVTFDNSLPQPTPLSSTSGDEEEFVEAADLPQTHDGEPATVYIIVCYVLCSPAHIFACTQ